MRKTTRLSLLLCALALVAAVAATLAMGQTAPAPDHAVKLRAAAIMDACMAQVRGYKEELGIPISPDDLHGTGMIGDPYTGITTTNGALEAKRTTANGDMAALVVQLLDEAGVRPGDRVGAGFSGSFPAMDLAVLSACAAMGVDLVYISSVGASTYGANQPQLTFPDMVYRLVEDGLLPQHGAAVSLGGEMDCGLDMDQAVLAPIRTRLEGHSVPLLVIQDFPQNVQARMALYEKDGPIVCFVGVGGNLTTSGRGENELPWGVIPPDRVKQVDAGSGLMERYNAQGLPVIHLLNIKRLVADYGLPYDPESLPAPGTSAVYQSVRYPRLPALLALGASALFLLWGRRAAQREGDGG